MFAQPQLWRQGQLIEQVKSHADGAARLSRAMMPAGGANSNTDSPDRSRLPASLL